MRPARRALGALPHRRHRAPPRPRRALVPPRPRRVVGRSARVRDPPQRSASSRRSGRTGRHAFERGSRTQLLVDGAEHTIAVLTEAGVVEPRPAAARPSAGACRRARVLPLGLPARRVPRRGIAERAAIAAPRGADAAPRRGRLRAQRRLRGRHPDAGHRPRVALRGVREELGRDRGVPRRRRRDGDRSRTRGAGARRRPPRRREPPRERRSREPRAAEPVCSRAARTQPRAARATGALDTLAPSLQAAAELRLRHPSLSLRELAAKAEPPVTKAAMAGRLARLVALASDERRASCPRSG